MTAETNCNEDWKVFYDKYAGSLLGYLAYFTTDKAIAIDILEKTFIELGTSNITLPLNASGYSQLRRIAAAKAIEILKLTPGEVKTIIINYMRSVSAEGIEFPSLKWEKRIKEQD